MKKIKHLSIRVEYEQDFTGMEVPDDVYEKLVEAYGRCDGDLNVSIEDSDALSQWVDENISEDKCTWGEYAVTDLVDD